MLNFRTQFICILKSQNSLNTKQIYCNSVKNSKGSRPVVVKKWDILPYTLLGTDKFWIFIPVGSSWRWLQSCAKLFCSYFVECLNNFLFKTRKYIFIIGITRPTKTQTQKPPVCLLMVHFFPDSLTARTAATRPRPTGTYRARAIATTVTRDATTPGWVPERTPPSWVAPGRGCSGGVTRCRKSSWGSKFWEGGGEEGNF